MTCLGGEIQRLGGEIQQITLIVEGEIKGERFSTICPRLGGECISKKFHFSPLN